MTTGKKNHSKSPHPPLLKEKPWKNRFYVHRAGRDVGRILQRYLFRLTADDEKVQNMLMTYTESLPLLSHVTAFVKPWRHPRLADTKNYFTTSGGEGGFPWLHCGGPAMDVTKKTR